MIEKCSKLLKKGKLTSDQFLDRIIHIGCKSNYGNVSNEEGNESGANEEDFNTSNEFVMNEVDCNASNEFLTNETDVNAVNNSPTESIKGKCISCVTKFCDIILIPCFHIVVCSDCWRQKKESHIKQCEILYEKNRKNAN